MPYQTLENFKYGLDTRRSEMTSLPGTLAVCDNAHINQGGEVEKRKAYELCGTVGLDIFFGYGIEAVQSGLVSFGTAAQPGGYPLYPTFSTTVPPVSYQRLTHPYGANMTQVLASVAYSGKAFVIAKFDDGFTLCYYDGTLVTDSSDGLIMGNLAGSNANIAAAIAVWINRTSRFTATSLGAVVTVHGVGTLSTTSAWSMTKTKTSTLGTLTLSSTASDNTNKTITVGGTWVAGDLITVSLLPADTSLTEQAGAGNITAVDPTYCFTFGNRVYLLAGSSTYFSALGEPTVFNDPNGNGNSFIDMGNYLGIIENVISVTHYQGKLAFFARSSIQIWNTDADPALFQQLQVLQNVGTFSKLGVQPLGDLDVFFITDTGLRSLRVRDSSNNAYVADVGSAIDSLLQTRLNSCTAAELAAICTIVEPSNNRLWLFIPCAALGTQIYVLSYFPTAKITAWSTYQPTIEGQALVQFTFVPQKFVIFEGKTYVRATYQDNNDYVFIYDGSTVAVGFAHPFEYDSVVATVETPWLDARKPGMVKTSKGVHASMDSTWTIKACMSYLENPTKFEETMKAQTKPTFDLGIIGFSRRGTHMKMRAETAATAKTGATLSALMWFYTEDKEIA